MSTKEELTLKEIRKYIDRAKSDGPDYRDNEKIKFALIAIAESLNLFVSAMMESKFGSE